jgi:amidase
LHDSHEEDAMDRRFFLAGGLAIGGALMSGGWLPRSAAGATELGFRSALDVARMIRRGEISSLELTTHLLERIRRHNGRLNAIVTLTADAALARARAADAARARREWWGPFHGVPATIKDGLAIAGVRTTAGAQALAGYVPPRDAAVVERVRAAGAVIVGTTNVPEWWSDWQSANAIFGATSNPWDVARTAGGSSGGEAAALAAGLTYLSIGGDLAGSIRLPAHCCGVYGHKPSLGIVPPRGTIPPPPDVPPGPPPNLAVIGPLARDASDLRAVLDALGGPDRDESTAYRWSLPSARRSRVADYRIGFVLDDPGCPVVPEAKAVLARTVEALRKSGATVEEGWPAGVVPAAQYATYAYLLMSTFAAQAPDDQLERLRQRAANQDGSFDAITARAWSAPVKVFQAAERERIGARAVWQEYFQTHDAFLLPTAFVPAFAHDHTLPVGQRRLITAGGARSYFDLAFWISFATLAGLPATTAPIGLTAGGLPVGVQILGPYLEDATPIDLAARLADLVGGFQAPTGYA